MAGNRDRLLRRLVGYRSHAGDVVDSGVGIAPE
jgi:hypothetical protein